jgi:hypothetical protein
MTTDGLLRILTCLKISSYSEGERLLDNRFEELKSILVDVEKDLHFSYNDDWPAA